MLTSSHQVIDDVLILSRLESEMLSITAVTDRPSAVVDNVVLMFSGEAATSGIEIEACRDRSYNNLHLDHVLCDTSRLTQILINLISNAIKFTSSRSKRKISVIYGAEAIRPPRIRTIFGELEWVSQRVSGRLNTALPALKEGEETLYLYFCVQDTGPGLQPTEIERLFKRFSQASSKTHISYGGSGLGLYISRELAEKQGGQVGVASRWGEGAVFAFYLESRKAETSGLELGRFAMLPAQPVTMVADRPGLPQRASSKAHLTKIGDAPDQASQAHHLPPQTDQPPSQQDYQPPASPTGLYVVLVEVRTLFSTSPCCFLKILLADPLAIAS